MKKKQGKVWWKGALLLFVLMVVGKIISVVIGPKPIAETLPEPEPPPYEERFSEGDRELITNESQYIGAGCPTQNKKEFEQAKASGIKAMQQRNYVAAEKSLNQAWSLCPAPETLIYLNNAKIGSAQALTLAITVPITHQPPSNAIQMLRGAAQTQSVINQSGGINGLPLKLIVIDDSDDPEVAKKIANTLISNDSYREVLAVVGHWTSGVTLQAAKVYNAQAALVFMTPISIIGDLTGGSWVFRSTMNMRDEQTALANYAYSSLKYKKVAVFYLDSQSVGPDRAAYSEGAKRLFRQFFQGEVIDIDFNLASEDFKNKEIATAKAMVKEAKKNGADAILLVPDNSLVYRAEAVIKAASSEGIGLLGATNLYRQDVLQGNCQAMVGMTLSMAWQAKGRANPSFVKSSADLWHGEVNFATAMTYNATQAMAAAMREKPTRAGVHEALNREGFVVRDTADAQPLKFENGDRIAPAQIVRVQTTAGIDPNAPSNVPECEFVPIN
jgi:branched-chain amino acid transport system substrate-binding protein